MGIFIDIFEDFSFMFLIDLFFFTKLYFNVSVVERPDPKAKPHLAQAGTSSRIGCDYAQMEVVDNLFRRFSTCCTVSSPKKREIGRGSKK